MPLLGVFINSRLRLFRTRLFGLRPLVGTIVRELQIA